MFYPHYSSWVKLNLKLGSLTLFRWITHDKTWDILVSKPVKNQQSLIPRAIFEQVSVETHLFWLVVWDMNFIFYIYIIYIYILIIS